MYESNWLLNNKNHTHPAPTTTFTIQSSCWLLVVPNDLPRTLTEMTSICNNDDFWFPCFVFGCTEPHTTIILTIATNGKTYQSGQDDNQIGCGWFWMGNRTSSTQQVKYVGYNVCVCFGSYFRVQNGPELILQFVFSVLLMAFLCLPNVQEWYGHWRISHAILIANSLVPIALCNENHHGHVPICIMCN